MQTLKTLSSSIHNTLNSIFLNIFDQPRQNENGSPSFAQQVFIQLWPAFFETLMTEEDARIYLQSISKLYTVVRNEDGVETPFFQCWSSFWSIITIRFPKIADDEVEILLSEFINRNQISFLHLLQVRILIAGFCKL